MKRSDDHEGLFSAARGFFSESLKKENVFGLGVPCGVFEILAKLIQDEKKTGMLLASGFDNSVLNRLQHLFGGRPIPTTVPLYAECAQDRHAKRFTVSCRHHRSKEFRTHEATEVSWKLVLRALRNAGQGETEISFSRTIVPGDAPSPLCGIRPKTCRDPFERLLRDGCQDVSKRRGRIFDVSLKMNRPHEPRVNPEQ